jgi:L-amino acid N-acyltransferase YncA
MNKIKIVYLDPIIESDLREIFIWQSNSVDAYMREAKGIPTSMNDVQMWYIKIKSLSNGILGYHAIRSMNNNLIGYLILSESIDNYLEIGIFIGTDRGLGFGKAALNEVKKLLRPNGYKGLKAMISQLNISSISFFKKNGFRENTMLQSETNDSLHQVILYWDMNT